MSHARGDKKNHFCSQAQKTNCDDCPITEKTDSGKKKNYVEICDPRWPKYTYPQYVARDPNPYVYEEKYEAHHILCVASVTEFILGGYGIQGAVGQTTWCINQKLNMLAMPLWGHTVKWYCRIGKAGGSILKDKIPPPFRNIPQHDISHNLYQDEVEQLLVQVACHVQDQDHDIRAQTLKKDLDDLSEHFVGELKDRGKRKGGTHEGWRLGQTKPDPDPQWCYPFSMAPDYAVDEIAIPSFDEKTEEWIDKIAAAIASGLKPG